MEKNVLNKNIFLANGYQDLQKLLPGLRVFGGCCGTDHQHLDVICDALFSTSSTG